MNKKFLLAIILMTFTSVQVIGVANAAKKPKGQQTAAKSKGLTELLTQQLGVNKVQAEGGAGAIFSLAKSKMASGAFTRLSGSIPDMQKLLAAAPAGGGDLSVAFQQLGLSADMPQKYVPIVMKYVHATSGEAMASVLDAALMGGF